MTATKTSKTAKDGAAAMFTLEMASESGTGNIAQATYLAKASDETLIDPMPASGGSVTANAGTNLNTSALATSANQTTTAAQGSATSGQTMSLEAGAVTTSAPSYTTGQTSPFSLNLAGGLRVDGSGVTQPVSGTFFQGTQPVSLASLPALASGSSTIGKVDLLGNAGAAMDAAGQNAASPANELLVAGQFNTSPTTITSGNVSPIQLDSAGNLLVNVKAGGAGGGAVTQSGTWTVQPGNTPNTAPWLVAQPDVRATGQTVNSATLNAAVSIALNNGEGSVAFNVAGLTASGAALTVECSDDGGTTWFAVNGVAPVSGALFTTLTADQAFGIRTAGRTNARLRVSTTGSGTVTIAYNASSVAGLMAMPSQLPAGTNTLGSVNLGTLNGAATNAGSNNISTAQVSVPSSATVISAARSGRFALTIINTGTTAVFVGGASVTAATGVLLPGVVGASLTIPTASAVSGIVASGTQTVCVLETF
ncbi:MAG: hypothetical protein M3Z96_13475 [Pseudomonadota bacterium]|nr:hypothetical protein [Pseudomonadota bacterium]